MATLGRITRQHVEVLRRATAPEGEVRTTRQHAEILKQTDAEVRLTRQHSEFAGQIGGVVRLTRQHSEMTGQTGGQVRLTRQHVELIKRRLGDNAVVTVLLPAITVAVVGTFEALEGDIVIFGEMDRPVYDTIEIVSYTIGEPKMSGVPLAEAADEGLYGTMYSLTSITSLYTMGDATSGDAATYNTHATDVWDGEPEAVNDTLSTDTTTIPEARTERSPGGLAPKFELLGSDYWAYAVRQEHIGRAWPISMFQPYTANEVGILDSTLTPLYHRHGVLYRFQCRFHLPAPFGDWRYDMDTVAHNSVVIWRVSTVRDVNDPVILNPLQLIIRRDVPLTGGQWFFELQTAGDNRLDTPSVPSQPLTRFGPVAAEPVKTYLFDIQYQFGLSTSDIAEANELKGSDSNYNHGIEDIGRIFATLYDESQLPAEPIVLAKELDITNMFPTAIVAGAGDNNGDRAGAGELEIGIDSILNPRVEQRIYFKDVTWGIVPGTE
jgi:hypothetical protein